jgi:hypothetical protein
MPHALLVNPWITDFAAYNFWIKPIGLLHLASLLKNVGFMVTLIDCLESYQKQKIFGDGKFQKVLIEKPSVLRAVPRNYSRYGISEETFRERLSSLRVKPDIILVTSGMTYWYPGLFRAIEIIKEVFPSVPVALGGIYATLCPDHALRNSGADLVIQGTNPT